MYKYYSDVILKLKIVLYMLKHVDIAVTDLLKRQKLFNHGTTNPTESVGNNPIWGWSHPRVRQAL